MSKNHRAGKKIGGKHTTIIDAAGKIIDFLSKEDNVIKITTGAIKMRLRPARHSLKISIETGCLLLKVRGSASIQEIRVFSQNLTAVKDAIEAKFPQQISED
jgi:hypothetical protein